MVAIQPSFDPTVFELHRNIYCNEVRRSVSNSDLIVELLLVIILKSSVSSNSFGSS